MKEVVEIRSTAMNTDAPIVEEVVRCEDLPPGLHSPAAA